MLVNSDKVCGFSMLNQCLDCISELQQQIKYIHYIQYLIAYAFLVFLDCMSENIIRDNVRGTDGYTQLVTKCEIMGKLAIPCSWKAVIIDNRS